MATESHGSSPAAWTGVGIILLASALICLGIIVANPWLWGAGVAGIVIGVAAWVGLQRAGYGEHSPRADKPAEETATSAGDENDPGRKRGPADGHADRAAGDGGATSAGATSH